MIRYRGDGRLLAMLVIVSIGVFLWAVLFGATLTLALSGRPVSDFLPVQAEQDTAQAHFGAEQASVEALAATVRDLRFRVWRLETDLDIHMLAHQASEEENHEQD